MIRTAYANLLGGISHFSWVKSSGSRATSNLWAGSSNSFVLVSIGRRTLQYSPSCTASSTLKLFLRRFFSLIRGAGTSAETQNSIIEPVYSGQLSKLSSLQSKILTLCSLGKIWQLYECNLVLLRICSID